MASPQIIYPVQIRQVIDEELTGPINGTNVQFTTSSNFINGTITVYLNGLKLKSGSTNDFIEIAANTIQLNYAPLPGDVVVADYLKQNA
jgi:hypothetical protein